MSRFLPLSAAVASIAIVFACTQQTSDAQQDTATPDEDMSEMQADMPPSEADMSGSESLPSMMRATGDLMGDDGNTIGSVNMIEGPNGIVMEVSIDEGGLTPGWHAIHIHQTGDCSDTGEYTASGGHVGKIDGGHGLLNPNGPEPGDLPNLYAFEDGSVNFETFTDLVVLSDVMDDDGGAIIIHEGRDDHMSQPIGGAGGRVACAVVQ
ncbi:MAG TPA: superoxide dismutase family protein [Henriciella marina]|uniref:superoxide dismutase family protein n=1 Tax=Henriciella sp. TaxID=1968823 RepID=UPI0017B6EC26|nr:superoxide dismutase family protein [Henriciella sp.]HIG21305.1 superoxide dismutase family protein [Henriciella sp.]HIK63809.1 superoxide dismutase family protein [Henriciella marina]